MRDQFTKNHPPNNHIENYCYLFYMVHALLKINHEVVQEWANAVLMPNHTFVITPNHTVLQGCSNFVRMYRHTDTTTLA